MKVLCVSVLSLTLCGCGLLQHALCDPHCHSGSSSSSSLVEYLYPNKGEPPKHDTVPELHVPLRVGLAFLPSHGVAGLDAAHQAELLERIKQRFKARQAVVDPASRSLVLRAGGWDVRHGSSTLINEDRDSHDASIASFSAATNHMIDHFDAELTRFEAEVRAGNANVRIVDKSNTPGHGGGGALGWIWAALLGPLVIMKRRRI